MYELAKISLNNRGNELKSNERRSTDTGDYSVLSASRENIEPEN